MHKELQRAVADARTIEANNHNPDPNENGQAAHTTQELQTTATPQ